MRTKVISIGEPLYDKAYILFGKPRNGVTLNSIHKALKRFEMHISRKARAALFLKVCNGHFEDQVIDQALKPSTNKGVDFYKFIKLLCKDYNSSIQDVLKQAKANATVVNDRVRAKITKPWEKVKNKIEGSKQLNMAMLKMEHDYVSKMALRECLAFIFKWVWLRSKNNFDERNILWNVLDRPSKYVDAEKFRQCIFKNMGLQINNKCLQQIMQKYGGGGENKINFDLFIQGYRAVASANSFNNAFTEHKTFT
eukprot:g9283.t1